MMLKYIIKLLQLCYNQYKVVIIVKKAKIFLSILFLVFSFVGPSFYTAPQVYAKRMDDRFTYQALQRMEGDWYNSKGAVVLSIHDGYINGCEVLGGYDFAGGASKATGKFLIAEANGSRYLIIDWNLPQYIKFYGETLYRY